MVEIKDILKMEIKNLSFFVNKKISVVDDCLFVVVIGFFGVGIIIIVLVGIVLFDFFVII